MPDPAPESSRARVPSFTANIGGHTTTGVEDDLSKLFAPKSFTERTSRMPGESQSNISTSSDKTLRGRFRRIDDQLKRLSRDYVHPALLPEVLKYDATVAAPIKLDQGDSPTCWAIQSLLGVIEEHYRNTNNVIVPSEPYTVASAMIFRAVQAATWQDWLSVDGKVQFSGDTENDGSNLLLRFGLVPSGAWQPTVPMEDWDFEELEHRLNGAALHLRRAIFAKAPDLLNDRRLFGLPQDLKERAVAVGFSLPRKFINSLDEEFGGIFDPYLGERPRRFEYQGSPYTSPVGFYTNLIDGLFRRHFIRIFPQEPNQAARLEYASYGTLEKRYLTFTNGPRLVVSSDVLDQVIIREINQGRSVLGAFEWIDNFAFGSVLSIPKNEPGQLDHGPHAVRIIGYQQDQSGRISALKIWNTHAGRQVMYMSGDYYRRFVRSIDLPRPEGRLSRLKPITEVATVEELSAFFDSLNESQ